MDVIITEFEHVIRLHKKRRQILSLPDFSPIELQKDSKVLSSQYQYKGRKTSNVDTPCFTVVNPLTLAFFA